MMFRFLAPVLLSTCATFAMTSVVAAADLIQRHNSNSVWFENWTGLKNATMVVAAPDGTISQVQATKRSPVYKLTGRIQDGVYRFELRAAADTTVDHEAKPLYTTGHFVVQRGAIITPEYLPEES